MGDARVEGTKRDLRWNLRVSASDDALVRAAARSNVDGLTAFVREAALAEAQRVLADRTRFDLDEAEWNAFVDLLDRPAAVPSGLADLFSKPSVFE